MTVENEFEVGRFLEWMNFLELGTSGRGFLIEGLGCLGVNFDRGSFFVLGRDRFVEVKVRDGKELSGRKGSVFLPEAFRYFVRKACGVEERKERKIQLVFDFEKESCFVNIGSFRGKFSLISGKDSVLDLAASLGLRANASELYKVPDSFWEGVCFCGSSVLRQHIGPLRYVFIDGKQGKIVGTDSVRVAKFMFKEEEFPSRQFLILPSPEFVQLKDFEECFFIGDSWFGVKGKVGGKEAVFITSFLSAESFPVRNVDSFFDFNVQSVLEFPQEFKDFVSVVDSASEEVFLYDKEVKVRVEEGSFFCESQGEGAKVSCVFAAAGVDFEGEFSINPLFLQEALRSVGGREVVIGKDRVLFRAGRFEYLVSVRKS